jgi:hypothetical protein
VAGVFFAHAALPGIAPASDLWDYSQEARQLARGQAFTSLYTYPVFLGQEQPPFPVRWRMPLYAALGALLLRLGIALPAGFLYLGAVVHAVLVALTYWLGARLSRRRAGVWAAAGAFACPLLLDFYNPGMSQSLAAVLGVVVWLLLLGERGALAGALAGVAAAAAWYLRGESILFVPVWIWLASRGAGPRWGRAVAFTVVYAALCAPWFLASRSGGGTIQGNPMLLYTAEYPGYSSSRTLAAHLPGMLGYVSAHPVAFALRFVKDMAGYGIDLIDGLGPIALLVAIGGVVTMGNRQTRATLRGLAPFLVAIALQIVAMSALERSPRFLVPVLPLVFVILGVLAGPALAQVTRRETFIAMVLALVLERTVRVAYQRGDALRRFPPAPADTAPRLGARARSWPTGALVLSDAPDWVSWHLDRPALLLPLRAQLDSLVATRPVAAIWLSPGARARNVADRDTAWVGAMDRGEGLSGFSGPDTLPGGSVLYVVRSDGPAHPGRQP